MNDADEFARRHTGLTRLLARSYASRTYTEDRAEVESDAWLGLARAADTFDPTRGASEATHVENCVRYAVLDGQRERRGRTPAQLDFHSRQRLAVRLSTPMGEWDSLTWADVIADTSDTTAATREERLLELVRSRLAVMTPRHREVIIRTLVNGEKSLDVAADWRVTEARISQIRRKAVNELRGLLGLPALTGPGVTTALRPCGTAGGYRRHLRRRDETCPACRAAMARHLRRLQRAREKERGDIR